MVAPVIVDASEIDFAGELKGEGSQVLLVWGTGVPYRQTGVRLGAVRLGSMRDDSKWRFFRKDQETHQEEWVGSDRIQDATEIASGFGPEGTAGEISVSFDPTLKEWRMVHGLDSFRLSDAEMGDSGIRGLDSRGVTIMRTARRPQGEWSLAHLLYFPKINNQPIWADEGYGRFIHVENQRVYRASPLASEYLPVDGPVVAGARCATTFPAYCSGPVIQDEFDLGVGCCTRSDRCCDFLFDDQGAGPGPGTGNAGNLYGQYLVPSFTKNFFNTPGGVFPDAQRIFWVASSLNPYVVVLMSTDLKINDWDNDNVPNDEDNCPLTANDQSNCNALAEEKLEERRRASDPNAKVARLGDACDPVPCPGALMDVIETTAGCREVSQFSVSGCRGREISDQIDFRTVGMGKRETLLSAPVEVPKTPIPVPEVETHLRFCQQNLDLEPQRMDCNDAGIITDEQLLAWPTADEERLEVARPWHRMKVARRSCRNIGGERVCFSPSFLAPPPLPRGASFPLDYGRANEGARWVFSGGAVNAGTDGDSVYWNRFGRGVVIPDAADAFMNFCTDDNYGTGTCLDGRIWLHANTTLGSGKFLTDRFAPNGELVGSHDEELSNHYVDVAPDRPVFKLYGGLRAREFFDLIYTLPDPPPVWRSWSGANLPLIRQDGGIFAVFDDGHREDASFLFSNALRSKLSDPDLLWVAPAEASAYVGGREAPHTLALSRDGTSVRSFVSRVEGIFRDDVSSCGPLGGDGCLPQPRLAAASTSNSAPAPSPRSDFVTVYSRAHGKLFLLGGRDAASGAALDELWTYRLEDGLWEKQTLKSVVGEVTAATYSWRDGNLWIIGRDVTNRRTTKLVAVEPTTGVVRVVASATTGNSAKYDTRGLFIDLEGNVGVYASSERSQKHRVALLKRVAGGYDTFMTLRRDRHLSARPIVDFRGVALYFEPDKPPVDRSKDPDDEPQQGDRTRASSRLRELPLKAVPTSKLADLLR